MLKCLLNENPVYAWEMTERDVDYRCPECKGPVILKRGLRYIPHFAHKKSAGCKYGEGMSQEHLEAQSQICQILRSHNIKADVEYRGFKRRRADVYVEDRKIVFEIQHSKIDPTEILERSQFYTREGCSIIWILTSDFYTKFGARYKTKEIRFPEWLQQLLEYYRVLYVWKDSKLYVYDFYRTAGDWFIKRGCAVLDLMYGLDNGTLSSFTSDIHDLALFGLDPNSYFPADWKYPTTDVDWNDPLVS